MSPIGGGHLFFPHSLGKSDTRRFGFFTLCHRSTIITMEKSSIGKYALATLVCARLGLSCHLMLSFCLMPPCNQTHSCRPKSFAGKCESLPELQIVPWNHAGARSSFVVSSNYHYIYRYCTCRSFAVLKGHETYIAVFWRHATSPTQSSFDALVGEPINAEQVHDKRRSAMCDLSR